MTSIIIIVVHLLAMGGLIWRYSIRFRGSISYPYFWPAFFWKMLMGMAAGLYLMKVIPGGGDSWLYFLDAQILAQWAQQDFLNYLESFFWGVPPDISEMLHIKGQPRAIFMAQLLSPLALLSKGNFWVIGAYLSLISFAGLWWIVHNLSKTYPATHKAAVMAFLFLPSTVFWTSSISKETLFMAGWGYLIGWSWPYFKNFAQLNVWRIAGLLIVTLILVKLKYYYMAVTLPILVATVGVYLIWPEKKEAGLRWLMLFILSIAVVTWLHPNLNVQRVFQVIKDNAVQLSSISQPQSTIQYMQEQNAILWCMKNAPMALISALLRPFWMDLGSIWQNLAVIENTLIFILGLGTLQNLSRLPYRSHWCLPILTYILLMAIFLALANPNFGTLARYKVVFAPLFLLLLLLKNPWWDKITERLP